jgi:hypothetical protein
MWPWKYLVVHEETNNLALNFDLLAELNIHHSTQLNFVFSKFFEFYGGYKLKILEQYTYIDSNIVEEAQRCHIWK